jgi:RHS repeat-associated protein
MTPVKRILLLVGLTILSNTASLAQVTKGTPPFGTLDGGSGPDVINLANLNVHFTIPVLHKAGRQLPFVFDLMYDSSVWNPVTSGSSTTWQPVPNWGWDASPVDIGSVVYKQTYTDVNQTQYYWTYTGFAYVDGFGTPHPFNATTLYICHYSGIWTCSSPGISNALATDGSGYTLNVSFISNLTTNPDFQALITPSDGSTINTTYDPYHFKRPVGMQDRNGNEITVASGVYTDTLGQTALTSTGSGTSASPLKFTYTAPGGPASYVVNYTNYTVATNFGLSITNEYKSSAAVPLVTSIVLPDNSQYTIQYESTPSTPAAGACTPYAGTTCVTARIKSITLPTGGSIKYTYPGGYNGVFSDGSTAGLTRVLSDGASWNATWTYARTQGTGAASTDTITDPLGDVTTMQFQGIYETQRVVNDVSLGLLETANTCYNGATSPCTGTAMSTPISSRTVTTILPGSANLQSKVATSFNTFGQLTEEDAYDYGSGAPGALLRKKLVNITPVGNAQTVEQTTIKDGAGNVKAQTTICYDEGTPSGTTTCAATGAPAATTGTPQHVSVPNARGNPTTVASLVSGTTTLGKTYTYYDTGNVNVATDLNGGKTTYSYGTSSCGNSFATGVIEAITTLTQSYVWNCPGGVETSATDENSQAILTSYTDTEFWRPHTSTDQLLNVTTMMYSGQTSVESSMPFNGTISTSDTLVTLDGLGRSHISQTKQGQSSTSYDSVETDYDAVGRRSRVTQPYSGTAGQTCSGCAATTTTYDALGRASKVTDPGNGTTSGTVTYSFPQNDVLMTLGPAPSKSRQMEYDGLGRLTSVCEITSTLPGNGACGQNTSATGYWTKYAYDANGNLTSVTQSAQPNGSPQTRSYGYDGLSRMTSETNPESGTTTYTYDSAPACTSNIFNGDLTEKVDASGNATCFWYDGLHRLLTEWVTSGPAQWGISGCKRFFYDNTNGTLGSKPSGVSVSNMLGRLTEAETDSCAWPVTQSSLLTDEWFSDTVRGETSDLWALTPHSGGYYHSSTTFWPNGIPNVVTGPTGYTMNYNVDGEGRVNSTIGGGNYLTGTTYNPAGQITQMTFSSSDTDTYSYDPSGRMNKYQYNVGSQSVVGTPSWNANGILGSLAITDPFNSSNTQTCNYSHDDLMRIASANCGSWSQNFSYDAFGNINKTGNSSFGATYSPTTNRMTTIGTQTPSYDADGNVTNDFLHSYSWDAYGRPLTIDTVGITYDALGRMVEQNRSGTYSQFAYSTTGVKLEILSGQTYQKDFVPLVGGSTEVIPNGGSNFYTHFDWLGSARLATTPSQTVLGDEAYAPFGETYAASGTPDNSFTGMDQGTVANEYDFPAREYGIQGRWPSPDPAGIDAVDPSNPQSWNRYAYVLNNPLVLIDPSGTDPCPPDGPFQICVTDPSGWPGGGGASNGGGFFSNNCQFSFLCLFHWRGNFATIVQQPPTVPTPIIDWRRTTAVNRCAGQLSQSGSVSNLSNGKVPGFLGSNTFGDIATLATGQGGVDQGYAVAVDATVHGLSNLAPQIAVGTAVTIGRAVSNTPGVYNPITVGTTTVTAGMTTAGKLLFQGAEGILTGKVLFDTGVYLGGLYVCSLPGNT